MRCIRSVAAVLFVLLAAASFFGTASAVTHAPSYSKLPAEIVALIDHAENMYVLRLDPDSIPGCDFAFTDSGRFTHCYPVVRKSPAPNEDWAEELGELFARSSTGAWNRDGCGYVPRNMVEIVETSRTSKLVVLTGRCDSTRVGLVMITPGTRLEYRELQTKRKALLDLLDRAILLDDAARIEGYPREESPPEEPVATPRTRPGPQEYVHYDEGPVPVTRVEPSYPEFAREAQIQGKVLLRVLVMTDGTVGNYQVIRGVVGLNEAAADAARKWRFRPAMLKGMPVAVWTDLLIEFRF
jgi:protein TonB